MPHAESMALPQSLAIGAVALDKQRFRRTFVAGLTRSWFFVLFVGGASGIYAAALANSRSISSGSTGTWPQRSTGPVSVTRISFSSRTARLSSGM